MKTKLILLIMLVVAITVNAQWQKISEDNLGVTARLTIHNSYVFYYGDHQGYKLYRYDENGENFADLTSSAAADFSHIYSFDGKLYGCSFSDIFISEDNGESWSNLSSVNIDGGNGVFQRFTSDGEILYGVSNRKSIFKSTDKGSTWEEIIINDPNNIGLLNMVVVGDYYLGILSGSGGWVSKDAGQTWAIINVNEATAIQAVYRYGDTIFGLTFNGVYRFDFDSDTWIASSSGLPSDGALYTVRSITSIGNSIFAAGSSLIGSVSSVYVSTDNGENWTQVNMENLPTVNAASSINLVAASSTKIFYSYYGLFDANNSGLYILPHSAVTSVSKINKLPAEFTLSQNYPNPFNPTTKINFSIPTNEFVTLNVYNTLGEKVAELVNQNLTAGSYVVDFNASALSSGIYFYSLTGKGFSLTKKLTLMK